MCMSSVIGHFWEQISDIRAVNWGWLVKFGTKSMSPIRKGMIFGSVVKVRVRLWLGLSK